MKRATFGILLTIFICTLTSGCGQTLPEDELAQHKVHILGQVMVDGEPIEGVTIKTKNSQHEHETVSGVYGSFWVEMDKEDYENTSMLHTEIYIGDELIGVTGISPKNGISIDLKEFDFLPSTGHEEQDSGELAVSTQALTNPACAERVLRRALRYRDPLNHCYAACELRRNCGTSSYGTVLLSYAKEICDILNWPGYCHDFSVGDLWADFVGLSCSYQSWRSCYSCCPK